MVWSISTNMQKDGSNSEDKLNPPNPSSLEQSRWQFITNSKVRQSGVDALQLSSIVILFVMSGASSRPRASVGSSTVALAATEILDYPFFPQATSCKSSERFQDRDIPSWLSKKTVFRPRSPVNWAHPMVGTWFFSLGTLPMLSAWAPLIKATRSTGLPLRTLINMTNLAYSNYTNLSIYLLRPTWLIWPTGKLVKDGN